MLAFITFLLVVTGFGIWGILRQWRFLVATQLRLDRCVGRVAKDFESKINRLESLNQQISVLRLAMAADLRQIPVFRPMVEGLAMAQDLTQVQWQARQVQWVAQRGCGELGDWPRQLPSLAEFRRPAVPEDVFGKKPLQWSREADFFFQVRHGSRSAAAQVSPRRAEIKNNSDDNPRRSEFEFPGKSLRKGLGRTAWQATWRAPQ